jgi:hypothetical protein
VNPLNLKIFPRLAPGRCSVTSSGTRRLKRWGTSERWTRVSTVMYYF